MRVAKTIAWMGPGAAVILLWLACAGDPGSSPPAAVKAPDATAVKAAVRDAGPAAMRPQKTCPVMGGAIDRSLFADHEGKRIYFCCAGCSEAFEKAPRMYLKKLQALGEKPETLR